MTLLSNCIFFNDVDDFEVNSQRIPVLNHKIIIKSAVSFSKFFMLPQSVRPDWEAA